MIYVHRYTIPVRPVSAAAMVAKKSFQCLVPYERIHITSISRRTPGRSRGIGSTYDSNRVAALPLAAPLVEEAASPTLSLTAVRKRHQATNVILHCCPIYFATESWPGLN